jgi:hypothetical protein
MFSINEVARCDDDRDELELIRFAGGRSLLRFVAPKEYNHFVRIKAKSK